MAIKFGQKLRKAKFGRFKWGETKNFAVNATQTTQNWKHDSDQTTTWKKP